MPCYGFDVCLGAEVLATVVLPLPAGQRDAVTLRRQQVPTSLAIAGSAPDPSLTPNRMLSAYRRAEIRHGNNREFRRRIGHHPETVKKAWKE